MHLEPEEPQAGPWQPLSLQALAEQVADPGHSPHPAPDRTRRIVTIDGRGGSGKSTLAENLAACLEHCTVLHTDDLAWHEPLFGWDPLLRDLLQQVRPGGHDVQFRPPAWDARNRPDCLSVPASTTLVLVEGSGATIADDWGLTDYRLWVQSDLTEAKRRGLARDVEQGVNGDLAEADRFWEEWVAVERPFFAQRRPWQVADLIVAGTAPTGAGSAATGPGEPPEGYVAVAAGQLRTV